MLVMILTGSILSWLTIAMQKDRMAQETGA